MATRTLNVQITGDSRNLNRMLDHTESRTKRWGLGMAKGFAVAGAAAAGGLAVGLKKSADAAIEAEKAQATMVAQLKASGVSYKAHAKQIDEVIQKHSKLSGLDDEDLQRSFTNIVRVTGDVSESLKLTGLAADFARAKHMDVAKAGELVGKVAGGNTGILARYGIVLDKGASSAEALAVLQQKFAGQAEAYGKTTAGSLDRAGVASENLGEIVGAKLTPLLAKGADALVKLVDASGQLGGPIRQASGVVNTAFKGIVSSFREGDGAGSAFGDGIRTMVTRVVAMAKRMWTFLKTTFAGIGEDLGIIGKRWLQFQGVVMQVVVWITKRTLPVLEAAFKGIAEVVRGVVKIIAGILSGDFSKAWDGAKLIVKGAIRAIVGILKGAGTLILDAIKLIGPIALKAMKAVGKAIVKGIVEGIKAAPGAIAGAIGDLIPGTPGGPNMNLNPAARRVGDGIGKSIGMLPSGGAFGGSLMGASAGLKPFAALGSGFGLSVTSGLRPGSITSSGNASWHGTGEAIDMGDGRGPDSNKLGFFNMMKSRFGGRLAELIYTPGGAGIKNGRPFTYSGQVAADHYDHVHVAMDLGRPGPGIGDGLGKFQATSYGPPWNAMNGTGVTATGVDLRPAKQAYGIAVDPSKLKLGKNYYVWPNPFGRRGPFKAFDTGGAIKGNHIDFYDWRGRSSQMSWGNRSVTVSDDPALNVSGGGKGKGKGPAMDKWTGPGARKPVTALEKIEAAIAMAALTDTPADDIKAADRLVKLRQTQLFSARGTRARTTAAQNLRGALDDRAALSPSGDSGSGGESDTSAADLKAAIDALTAAVTAQTQFGERIQSTENFQLKKYLADVIGGQVVGYGVAGRAFTPGTGVEFAY